MERTKKTLGPILTKCLTISELVLTELLIKADHRPENTDLEIEVKLESPSLIQTKMKTLRGDTQC